MWVEPGDLAVERVCVYVMEDFSSQHYKSLEGQCRCVTMVTTPLVYSDQCSRSCRIVGPLVVLGHIKHGWVSHCYSNSIHGNGVDCILCAPP